MDHAVASTINRRDVRVLAEKLDSIDFFVPWQDGAVASVLLDAPLADRIFLTNVISHDVKGISYDGAPADCDWDDFFTHFRAEIEARRDPKTPPAGEAETRPGSVV